MCAIVEQLCCSYDAPTAGRWWWRNSCSYGPFGWSQLTCEASSCERMKKQKFEYQASLHQSPPPLAVRTQILIFSAIQRNVKFSTHDSLSHRFDTQCVSVISSDGMDILIINFRSVSSASLSVFTLMCHKDTRIQSNVFRLKLLTHQMKSLRKFKDHQLNVMTILFISHVNYSVSRTILFNIFGDPTQFVVTEIPHTSSNWNKNGKNVIGKCITTAIANRMAMSRRSWAFALHHIPLSCYNIVCCVCAPNHIYCSLVERACTWFLHSINP